MTVDRLDPDVAKVLAHHRATAVRADAVRPGPRIPWRHRAGEHLAAVLVCPACLTPRIIPWHRLRGCR